MTCGSTESLPTDFLRSMVFGRATLCRVAWINIISLWLPPSLTAELLVIGDFRYRKTLACEIFFLRDAVIRGKDLFR